jgi:hypothetical protein
VGKSSVKYVGYLCDIKILTKTITHWAKIRPIWSPCSGQTAYEPNCLNRAKSVSAQESSEIKKVDKICMFSVRRLWPSVTTIVRRKCSTLAAWSKTATARIETGGSNPATMYVWSLCIHNNDVVWNSKENQLLYACEVVLLFLVKD